MKGIEMLIKIAIEECGMKQFELAEKLGISQGQTSRMLKNAHLITLERLEKIAKFTGKPLSFFLEEGDKTTITSNGNVVGHQGKENRGNIVVNEPLEEDNKKLKIKVESLEKQMEVVCASLKSLQMVSELLQEKIKRMEDRK